MREIWSYSSTKIHFRFILYIFFAKKLKIFLSRAYEFKSYFGDINTKTDPKIAGTILEHFQVITTSFIFKN